MSTMADQGQYFTDRMICNLAFKLAHMIHPETRRADGTLCRFADLFCGTGGFVGAYVKGISTLAKEKGEIIDWMKESKYIYAVDKDLASVRLTLLNLLIQTGTPFSEKNIIERNSFQQNIIIGKNLEIAPFMGEIFDFEFMNPPYGGDKSKGKDYKFAYAKGKGADKKYLVNSEIQSIGIEDDDKVSAGVQLSMATLSADGGVCCIVLPQGFFFGKGKYTDLRKKIAEEYKIHYIVDIASGAFANTGTKTSMMVFQKGVGATEKVSFIGFDEMPLVEATLTDLRAKQYSLNFKQYLPQSAVEVEGFEMVKLSEIVSFKAEKSKKDKASYTYIDIGSVDRGNFKAGESISKVDLPGRAQYSVNIGDILLGTVRPNLEHYLLISPQVYRDDLIVSNGFSIMRCDTTKVLSTYLYSSLTLPTTTAYLTERATGTTYPVVDDTIIGAMTIPLPSLERQAQIVEAIDGWASLAQQEEVALKILEKQMMFQVKEMGRGQARVKLGEVCEWQMGKRIVKDQVETGNIPVYGGGGITFYTNTSNRHGINCKISREGMSEANCVLMITGEYHQNSQGMTVGSKDTAKTIDPYLWYWLAINKESVYECGQGTAQKAISMIMLNDLEIPLPPLTEQQTLQSDFDEIRHKHAKIAEYKAKAQAAIQRLIPGAAKKEEELETEEPEAEVEEEEIPSTPSPTLSIIPLIPLSKPDYKAMSKPELLEQCKKNNLKGCAPLKKEELIKRLEAL